MTKTLLINMFLEAILQEIELHTKAYHSKFRMSLIFFVWKHKAAIVCTLLTAFFYLYSYL